VRQIAPAMVLHRSEAYASSDFERADLEDWTPAQRPSRSRADVGSGLSSARSQNGRSRPAASGRVPISTTVSSSRPLRTAGVRPDDRGGEGRQSTPSCLTSQACRNPKAVGRLRTSCARRV